MSEIQETLQSIARKGMEECYELGKFHGAVNELEKLKADMVVKLCLGKECDNCLFLRGYGICEVKEFIEDRISKLKGEQE